MSSDKIIDSVSKRLNALVLQANNTVKGGRGQNFLDSSLFSKSKLQLFSG